MKTATDRAWAGFVIQSAHKPTITTADGYWEVPAVTCATTETSASLVWAGLGGQFLSYLQKHTGSHHFEPLYQSGTGSICEHGQPDYYAWEEEYTAGDMRPQTKLSPSEYPVEAGDYIQSTITVQGSETTDLMIDTRNRATLWTYHGKWASSQKGDHTAECIVEDPETAKSPGYISFSDFGSVTFDTCYESTGMGTGNKGLFILGRGPDPGLSSSWSVNVLSAKDGETQLASTSYPGLTITWKGGNGD
jgi:Peptidase A4 family